MVARLRAPLVKRKCSGSEQPNIKQINSLVLLHQRHYPVALDAQMSASLQSLAESEARRRAKAVLTAKQITQKPPLKSSDAADRQLLLGTWNACDNDHRTGRNAASSRYGVTLRLTAQNNEFSRCLISPGFQFSQSCFKCIRHDRSYFFWACSSRTNRAARSTVSTARV
jgi:hypothetical protein